MEGLRLMPNPVKPLYHWYELPFLPGNAMPETELPNCPKDKSISIPGLGGIELGFSQLPGQPFWWGFGTDDHPI